MPVIVKDLLISRAQLVEIHDEVSTIYKGRHLYCLKDDAICKGYEEIPERTYGKMDASSPIKGFMCNAVAVAFVIIVHCEKTKRTAVMYNVSDFEYQILVRHASWVTDDSQGVPIDFVILKGNAFSPWETNPYAAEDNAWLAGITTSIVPQLESLFNTTIRVTLPHDDNGRCLELACVLVDKATATVTIPRPKDPAELTRESRPGNGAHEQSYNLTLGKSISSQGSDENLARNLAASLRRMESTIERTYSMKGYTAELSYDVDERILIPPLSDCARELLRSQYLDQPPSRRMAIMRRYDPEPSTRYDRYKEVFIYMTATTMVSKKGLCDVEDCRKLAKVVCKTCGGSWACSERHQKEYADDHEEWCKSHKIRI